MDNMQQLTLVETLDEIKYLIAESNGDSGRLAHILETLKNKKTLYQSDQNYLENKLGVTFSLEDQAEIRKRSKNLPIYIQYYAGLIFDGHMEGLDQNGRMWRRQGTVRSHPWYYKPSLTNP